MQFTNEVNWAIDDFFKILILKSCLSFTCEFVNQKSNKIQIKNYF